MPDQVLTDGVVLLSPPHAGDVDDIVTACRDPEVVAWTTVPAPYDRADAEAFLTRLVEPGWASGRDLAWAVRVDGRMAGMVGLHGIGDGTAALGYWTAPWGRRRGLTNRAVALVVDHAFDPEGCGLVRLTWDAFVGNWPSRRVAWRAGFRFEGTSRLHGLQRGTRRDSWVATLLADDPREPCEPWPLEPWPPPPGATGVDTHR